MALMGERGETGTKVTKVKDLLDYIIQRLAELEEEKQVRSPNEPHICSAAMEAWGGAGRGAPSVSLYYPPPFARLTRQVPPLAPVW